MFMGMMAYAMKCNKACIFALALSKKTNLPRVTYIYGVFVLYVKEDYASPVF